ncbi:MAG: N(G),N(G)-dimethylarginine dimethylaminohydrolase [Myxococcota bacterium]|nr:N(G),N(G)-dimethylarginine dimethylaminohydrolase [Myxococcota bacterium]
MTLSRALVRGVPDSFADCELTWIERRRPDVQRARHQHAAYIAQIAASGLELVVLPPDSDHPDCVFVEDIALDLGHLRVLTSPGADSRRNERSAVAAVLGEHVRMPEELRLDGGDVFRVGGRLFVGLSTRTSPEALVWLEEVSRLEVVPVELDQVLHLKTAATALDDRTLLCWPDSIDEGAFSGFEIIHTDGPNVLRLPDRVLVRSGTQTAGIARSRGYQVVELDISEFTVAEASLTCMSVLLHD